MHSTNKAFDRYFDVECDDIRGICADTAKSGKSRIDTPLTPQERAGQKGELLKLK